jgi:choline transport protein
MTVILSLINIGSSAAFNAIISLQLSSLMLTYAVSIACVLYRRIAHPELLPKARWSLGRFGVVVNGVGLVYSIFVFFWCFWPGATPVTPKSFNWAILMFTALVIASTTTYLLQGRKVYAGPVSLVNNGRMSGIA